MSMTWWVVIALAIVLLLLADAYRRRPVYASVVDRQPDRQPGCVVQAIDPRMGDGGAWRWFAIDAKGDTRGSCLPRRFTTRSAAVTDGLAVFPLARVLRTKQ